MLAFCVLLQINNYLLFKSLDNIFHHDRKTMPSLLIESFRRRSIESILVYPRTISRSHNLSLSTYVSTYARTYVEIYKKHTFFRWKVYNVETGTLGTNYETIDCISIRGRNTKRVFHRWHDIRKIGDRPHRSFSQGLWHGCSRVERNSRITV